MRRTGVFVFFPEYTMIYFLLTIGIIFIIFLSFTVCGLWLRYINTKVIKFFLLPGTIVHELSHALLCLATGTTIKELNLFSPNTTGIKYDRPKIPGIFDFIITSAPVFGCAAFIFFIPKIFSNPVHFDIGYPQEFYVTFSGFLGSLSYLFNTVFNNLIVFKEQLHIGSLQHILFLLAIIIFTVSFAPQKQDIKYLVIGFGILSGVIFLVEKFGIRLSNYRWWKFCIKEFWAATTLTLSVLVSLLFITLCIMGFLKVYTLIVRRKGSSTSKGFGKSARKGNND
ncbi:MAG: hypothetical protein E3K32_12975 [wastewater metagenome]|nr:hypothetical protein [Candidatus Loosdrechtia aerotolerans]